MRLAIKGPFTQGTPLYMPSSETITNLQHQESEGTGLLASSLYTYPEKSEYFPHFQEQ